MASTAAVLNILVSANTGTAVGQLSILDKKLKGTAATANTTSGSIAAKFGKKAKFAGGIAALGIAAGVATKQLYDVGKELDAAYDKIRTGTGATGKQLDNLKKDFRAVAGQVPDDFKTTGTAIADLNTRLGLTGKPLRKMARDMLDLSRMTETDVAGNIKGVARAFVDWEVPMKQQGKNLNGFFRLSQKSGMEVGELTSRIQEFGSPLRTLGFDVGEAASMFAGFERAGVNTATMLPGLKFAIKNIARPAGEAAVQMEKLGITTKDPAKGLREAFEQITAKGPDALNKQEKINAAMGIFGQRAGPDMAEAIKQGRFELGDYMKVFEDGTETIGKSDKATRSAGENMKTFGNQLKILVAPAAEWVHTAITDLTLGMLEGFKAVKRFTKTNEDFKDALKAVGVVLKAFGAAAKWSFDMVKEQLKGLWGTFKGVMQLIKGVVKVVSGVLTGDWAKAWDGVKDIFRGGAKIVLGVMRTITAPMRKLTGLVAGVLTGVFGGAWNKVTSIFSDGASAILGIVRGIIEVINLIPGVKINIDGANRVDLTGGSGKVNTDSQWPPARRTHQHGQALRRFRTCPARTWRVRPQPQGGRSSRQGQPRPRELQAGFPLPDRRTRRHEPRRRNQRCCWRCYRRGWQAARQGRRLLYRQVAEARHPGTVRWRRPVPNQAGL
jgi:TP901 family phage tail tape measure protein